MIAAASADRFYTTLISITLFSAKTAQIKLPVLPAQHRACPAAFEEAERPAKWEEQAVSRFPLTCDVLFLHFPQNALQGGAEQGLEVVVVRAIGRRLDVRL